MCPAARLAGSQGDGRLQADGEQHGPIRPERVGRLGTDHLRQRRVCGQQGLEDARRQGIPRRTGADRRPDRHAGRLCQRPGPHRLGHARHAAAVHAAHRGRSNGKPKDSRVMPRIYQQVDWSCGGDGIIVRENIRTVARPARQEDRAGAELALPLLRAEHAGVRRRAAVRSRDGLHARPRSKRPRPSTPTRILPPPSPGLPISTTWRRSRATDCWSPPPPPTS